MSGPDRLPDSGIYLAVVVGGWGAELSLTQGPDKHFPYRGGSMPFMMTGARDSALPIMHYHTVLSYPQSRHDTHTWEEKPQ